MIDTRAAYWDTEYSKASSTDLPSSKTDKPSRAVINFIEELNPEDKTGVLDIGSGNGRNSFFLVQEQEFKKAYGVELSSVAVENASSKARELGLEDKISFVNQSAGDKIDQPNKSFSLAIDMMVMHALTQEERKVMINEVIRLLRPNGYFVFYTLAAESEEAQKLIQGNPGAEENSYKFDINGHIITEKTFTREEIQEMLSPLKLIKLEKQDQSTTAFGGTFNRAYYFGVFQK